MTRLFPALLCLWGTVTMVSADSSGWHRARTPRSIVAWWTGEDHAQDVLGKNHGALRNGTKFAIGKVGQAFDFDGQDDYVIIPDSESLDSGSKTGQLTVEAWIRWRGTIMHDFSPIVRKMVSDPDDLPWATYDFGVSTESKAFLVVTDGKRGGKTASVATVSTIAPGEWVHLAGTYDGTELKIYSNGVLEASRFSTVILGDREGPLILGANERVSDPRFSNKFDGLIDEIGIYNRALAASDILAIYAAGSLGKSPLGYDEK